MTGVLASYLRRRVATHTIALTAMITGLLQVLGLMEVTTDVLDRGLGLPGLVYYALLRAPGEVVLALPLAALLGAISSLHDLARNHEIVAIRAAGISMPRMVAIVAPVALLVSVAHFTLSQTLVPAVEAELKTWWESTAPPDEETDRRWARTNAGPVSYASASANGERLKDVRIYLRGSDRLLSERIAASEAIWDLGEWRLEGVEVLQISSAGLQRSEAGARNWKTNLQPDDVRRLELLQPRLSSIMLVDVIAGQRVGSQPLSYYQTALYRTFSVPFTAFIMLLLAMPTAYALPRQGAGSGLLIALGLGLAFLACDGIMAALGTSGRIPALAAALAAPLVFTSIACLRLSASERA